MDACSALRLPTAMFEHGPSHPIPRSLNYGLVTKHPAPVTALGFSDDSRWLITGDVSGEVRCSLLDSGPQKASENRLTGPRHPIVAVSLSRDGRRLLVVDSDRVSRFKSLTVWPSPVAGASLRPRRPEPLWRLPHLEAASPDGRWALSRVAEREPTYLWELTAPNRRGSRSRLSLRVRASMESFLAQMGGGWEFHANVKPPSNSGTFP